MFVSSQPTSSTSTTTSTELCVRNSEQVLCSLEKVRGDTIPLVIERAVKRRLEEDGFYGEGDIHMGNGIKRPRTAGTWGAKWCFSSAWTPLAPVQVQGYQTTEKMKIYPPQIHLQLQLRLPQR
jgi:hypothetical protein